MFGNEFKEIHYFRIEQSVEYKRFDFFHSTKLNFKVLFLIKAIQVYLDSF